MATEKRLIDANGSYTINASDNTGYSLCFGGGIISVFDDFGRCVCEFDAEDAPTVDAVEVVHGRWVQCKDWDYDYECSVCEGFAGEDADGNYNKLTPYCPNCGAKMRGSEE